MIFEDLFVPYFLPVHHPSSDHGSLYKRHWLDSEQCSCVQAISHRPLKDKWATQFGVRISLWLQQVLVVWIKDICLISVTARHNQQY